MLIGMKSSLLLLFTLVFYLRFYQTVLNTNIESILQNISFPYEELDGFHTFLQFFTQWNLVLFPGPPRLENQRGKVLSYLIQVQ